jgi:membrane protein
LKIIKIKTMDRGHDAVKPRGIPSAGWKDIGKRIITQVKDDHVQVVSAGVAFYFFLSLFPAIAALVSIYGLVLDPGQIQEQLASLKRVMPGQTYDIINGIIQPIASQSSQTLSWSIIFSILISLWSANKGTAAIFESVNIAYDEKDDRNFFKKTGITLGFTLGGILLGIIGVVVVILFPSFIENFNFSNSTTLFAGIIRWIVMGLIMILALSLIYKIAPDRDNPRFRWVNWGATIATILWILGSVLFTWYIKNFNSYGDTYGSFASVIILLLWFLLTAFVIILGAEINSEMEHQTKRDTTVGEREPMGERGAYHADHVAGKDL